MISQDQLNRIGIYEWSELANKFNDSNLLLGNGFSRKLAPSFKYDSLFEEFLKKTPANFSVLFKKFYTTNFEQIMQRLSHAMFVNNLFHLDDSKIAETAQILKNGLITTIRGIHPSSEDIFWDKLGSLANEITNFRNIFTINYDLFLYHIVMILKDRWDKSGQNNHVASKNKLWRYSDFFYGKYNDEFKTFVPFQDKKQFRAIYYLHGALFIFRLSNSIDEMKLLRANRSIQLIDLIGNVIEDGIMPVFVCEGDSSQKLEQINSSTYLKFAHRNFEKEQEHKFVIYGCSLSEHDNHIVNALDKSDNILAISLHINGKSIETLQRIKLSYDHKFNHARCDFFDSESLFNF